MASTIDPSTIDVTIPADGTPASKSNFRSQFADIKAAFAAAVVDIEANQSNISTNTTDIAARVENISSSVPSIQAGTTGSRPSAGTTGRIFIDTTQNLIQRDNGTSWDTIGNTSASTIDYSVTDITGDYTLTAADVAVTISGSAFSYNILRVRNSTPANTVTITLPDSDSISEAGAVFNIVVAEDQTGVVSVARETNGTINGTTSVALNGPSASASLIVTTNTASTPTARLEGETNETRTIYGNTTFNDNLEVDGTTQLDGVTTINGNVTLAGTINPSGGFNGNAISNYVSSEEAISGAETVAAADRGRVYVATAALTVTIPSVGTLGDGAKITIINDSGGTVTIDGPGGTNVDLADGEIGVVVEANSKQYVTVGTHTIIS